MFLCCNSKKSKKNSYSKQPKQQNPNSITNTTINRNSLATNTIDQKQPIYFIKPQETEQPSTNQTSNLPNQSILEPEAYVTFDIEFTVEKLKILKNQKKLDLYFQEEKQCFLKLYNNQKPPNHLIDSEWFNQYLNYLKQLRPSPERFTQANPKNLQIISSQLWNFLNQLYREMDIENENQCQLSNSLQVYLDNSLQNESNLPEFLSSKQPDQKIKFSSLEDMQRKDLPNFGLENPKYFCYINSQLNWFFFSSNLQNSQFPFLSAYKEIIQANTKQKIFPQQLISLIGNKLSLDEQHDCQEFMLYLFDKWQNELKQPIFSDKKVAQTSQEAFEQYCSNNQTIIDELFYGQMTSSIICQNCNEPSLSFEPFCDISLPLNKQYDSTLYECLTTFFKDDIIEDQWICECCQHKHSNVKRTLAISHAPNILILHLKRFAHFPKQKKIKTNVEFSMILKLSRFCEERANDCVYTLKSIIIHIGTLDAGHYIAVTKRLNKVNLAKYFIFSGICLMMKYTIKYQKTMYQMHLKDIYYFMKKLIEID